MEVVADNTQVNEGENLTVNAKLTRESFDPAGACTIAGFIEFAGEAAALSQDYIVPQDGLGFSISLGPNDIEGTDGGFITIVDDTIEELDETFSAFISGALDTTGCFNGDFSLTIAPDLLITINANDHLSGQPNLTETQTTVAQALDELCATTQSSALANQCAILNSLPPAEVSGALQQIAPDEISAQGINSVKMSSTQLGNIKTRLLALRNRGYTMLAFNDFSLGINGETLPGELFDAVWFSDTTGGGASIDSLSEQGRLGMFLNGRLNYGDKETTAKGTGFDFYTNGITFGIDYRLTNQLILGGALGYANSDSHYDADGGELDTNSLSFTLYGSLYSQANDYIDWLVNWGNNQFDTVRNIVISGTSTTTAGSTDGIQLGISINAGMNISAGDLTFNPYARVEYIESDIDAYEETGGMGLALAIAEQRIESLTTVLAARLSQSISKSWGILSPNAYIEWEHEFEDDSRFITAKFVEDPTVPFSIPTDANDPDYFNIGIGLSTTLANGNAAFINYETVYDQDNIKNYTIDFGLRMEF